MDGEEKSHVVPIPSKTGFPRFIEFASLLITMNVSKERMIELKESENEIGNFSFPSFDSVDTSAEVILMLKLLRVIVLGIAPYFSSLSKNAVLITGTLIVFPESMHAFNLMLLMVRVTFTFIDGTRYFTANDSLIHLKIDKEPVKSCGQEIFGTDFDKIYIINLDYQEPIKANIKSERLSLMRDYAPRDAWVFNRMTQMLHDNILALTRKHSHDTTLSQTNWLRIVTSYKLDSMAPFSLSPESAKVLMPVRKNLIVYKCAKKLLKPKNLNNGKCYKHLPVTTLNREFIPQSNTNTTMFLTPHSRIISNVGVEIPCSDVFITKLKTYTGNWFSYTKKRRARNFAPKEVCLEQRC